MSVLLNDESDAELDAKSVGTWIGVGDLFSVCIHKTDEGVVVDIHARGYEDCNCLASCYAFKNEALDMQEERSE